jgi:hypothetical protein
MRRGMNRLEEIVRPKQSKNFQYEKADDTQQVRRWTCGGYTSYYDGDMDAVYAVAAWDDVGISYDDVKILVELRDNFGDIPGKLGYVTMWSADVAGFPVLMESYDGEVLIDVTRMGSIVHGEFDSRLFDVTEHYDEQPFFESTRSGAGFYSLVGGGSVSASAAVRSANEACKKPIHGE